MTNLNRDKSTAKAVIMERIRLALNQSQRGAVPEVPRNYRQISEFAPGSAPVVEMMVAALEDYKAKVRRCHPDELVKTLAEVIKPFKSVVVPHGLNETWMEAARSAGVEVRVDNPETGEMLSKAELDNTEAVLTASRCGIALSGTIVLDGESDQGRRAISLVPDNHVCVINSSTIFELVPQAVALLKTHPTRPTTWFAGPSATSDIELRRVDGVHGPRNLTVIIVDDIASENSLT